MNQKRRNRSQQLILGAVAAMSFASIAEGTTYTWSGSVSGNNWNTAVNWTTNLGTNVAPPQAPTSPDVTDLVFTGSFNANQTSTQNTGTIDVNSILFKGQYVGTATIGLSGASTGDQFINLGAGGLLADVLGSTGNGGTVTIINGVNRKIILTADQTWRNNNTFGIVSQRRTMEGNFKITKTGPGTIEFQGSNNLWTGGLQIDEGTIRTATTNNALGVGTITANTVNNVSISASGGSGPDQIVAGQLILGGTGSFGLGGSFAVQFNNLVTLLNDKTISVSNAGTFNEAIVGSGGITKSGTGTMVFNSTNSYAGNTTVSNGYLSFGSFGQVGTALTQITLGGTTVAGGLDVRNADQTTSRNLVINPGGASINFAGNLTVNGTITSASGSLNKVGGGVLTTGALRIGGTLIATTGAVVTKPDGTDAASNRVGSLTLGGSLGAWGSKLDLSNNHLVVDYTAASPLATVADQIKSGYAGGAWTGNGITSASAATVAIGLDPHKTALGYIEASTLGIGTFAGQGVDTTSIVVRYTLSGDANADGTVNALDFNALASGFGSQGLWFNGDFNYDGTVNGLDFGAVATNFNLSMPAPGPAIGVLVPEPATLGGLSVLALSLLRRRRH